MHDAIREMAEAGTADREPEAPAVGTTTDEEHRTSGVQTAEGTVVTVFDCEVFDDDTYDVETDEVKIAGVITILRVVSLERSGQIWNVIESKVSQKIEGVAGCYLASDTEFPY